MHLLWVGHWLQKLLWVGAEMAYITKTNTKLVNAEWAQWEMREKDKADVLILE